MMILELVFLLELNERVGVGSSLRGVACQETGSCSDQRVGLGVIGVSFSSLCFLIVDILEIFDSFDIFESLDILDNPVNVSSQMISFWAYCSNSFQSILLSSSHLSISLKNTSRSLEYFPLISSKYYKISFQVEQVRSLMSPNSRMIIAAVNTVDLQELCTGYLWFFFRDSFSAGERWRLGELPVLVSLQFVLDQLQRGSRIKIDPSYPMQMLRFLKDQFLIFIYSRQQCPSTMDARIDHNSSSAKPPSILILSSFSSSRVLSGCGQITHATGSVSYSLLLLTIESEQGIVYSKGREYAGGKIVFSE